MISGSHVRLLRFSQMLRLTHTIVSQRENIAIQFVDELDMKIGVQEVPPISQGTIRLMGLF
jgi:hypothetical protein